MDSDPLDARGLGSTRELDSLLEVRSQPDLDRGRQVRDRALACADEVLHELRVAAQGGPALFLDYPVLRTAAVEVNAVNVRTECLHSLREMHRIVSRELRDEWAVPGTGLELLDLDRVAPHVLGDDHGREGEVRTVPPAQQAQRHFRVADHR